MAFVIAKPKKIYLDWESETQPYLSTDLFVPLTTGVRGTWDADGNDLVKTIPSKTFDIAAQYFFPSYDGHPDHLINMLLNSRIRNENKRVNVETIFIKEDPAEENASVACIRQDVYKKLLQIQESSSPKPADILNDLQIIKESFDVYMERRKERLSSVDKALEELLVFDELHSHCREISKLYHCSDDNHNNALKPYRDALLSLIVKQSPTSSEAIALATDIAAHLRLSRMLTELNKFWQPSYTAHFNLEGSLTLAYKFNAATADIAAKQFSTRFPDTKKLTKGMKALKNGRTERI